MYTLLFNTDDWHDCAYWTQQEALKALQAYEARYGVKPIRIRIVSFTGPATGLAPEIDRTFYDSHGWSA